jgi:Bacterial membrane protein YfhO
MQRRARSRGPLSWARRWPRLTALFLYLVLAVLFFAPGLLPGRTTSSADYLWSAAPWNTARPSGVPVASTNPPIYGTAPELVDPATVFEPFLQYTRSQLPRIPLWDPYIMGGTPYLADMQSAVFSPFSVPAYVFPFWWSLSVIAVMKLVVAAMGAFLLARALRMGFAGSFVAGTVFGFGLFLVAWLPWPLANVFPWIPWLLLATEKIVRRPGVLPAAGLSVVVALQFFGGHPESSFHALFATTAFFVLRVLQKEGGGAWAAWRDTARRGTGRAATVLRTLVRPALTFLVAIGVGTAVAAVVIIPFIELLHNSSDLSARPRAGVHVQAKYFFAALLPGYFPKAFEIETAFYAGAMPIMLAVIALLRPRVERVAVAVFSALSLLVVLGVQPFFGAVSHLPGFDVTYNSRLTILYLMGIALLAGWGLDDLVRRSPARGTRLVTRSLVPALVALPVVVLVLAHGSSWRYLGHSIVVALGFDHYPNPNKPHAVPVIRLSGLVVWLLVAVSAAALLWARTQRPARLRMSAGVFAALAMVLVAGDMFQAGVGENPAIPESHAVQPATPAIRLLQTQAPARFAAVNPVAGVVPLPPDVGLRYGLYDARGYDYPVTTRFARLWTRYVAPPVPLLSLDTPAVPYLFPNTLRVLSLLGVTHILQQSHEPTLQLPGLGIVYEGNDATIYSNADALPRAWLVGAQKVTGGGQQSLDEVVSPDFDPRHVVLTERRLPRLPVGSGPPAAAAIPSSEGSARITRYTADEVSIETDSATPSELVLSDTYYPGWHATVDGRPVPVDRVDYMLRGVALPPGSHRVEFTYDPSSFRVGWIVSAVAILAVGVASMVAWTSQRRRRRPTRWTAPRTP